MMSGTAQPLALEDRLAALHESSSSAIATLHEELAVLQWRIRRLEASSPRPLQAVPRPIAERERGSRSEGVSRPHSSGGEAARAPRLAWKATAGQSLGDVVGGRVLAWVGGIATLVGTVLFLALAIARGWIGQEARVIMAAVAAAMLMSAGTWLHERRGRTEASAAMVGAASAAMFATLLVATQVYGLLSIALALPMALAVGALTTMLAVRWAGRAVGGIGLLGGLLSPVLVGASPSAVTIAVLIIAAACVTWVVVRTGWGWLGLASLLVSAPQWGSWLLEGQTTAADLAVLVCFATLGLVTTIGLQAHAREARLHVPAVALLTLGAFATALIGREALDGAAGGAIANGWLGALAILHLSVGKMRLRRGSLTVPLGRLLIAIGVVLADVALGLACGGLTLLIAWSGAAVAFAWLARRTERGGVEELLMGAALGVHLALALVRAVLLAPPGALGSGDQQLVPLMSVCVLAAGCLGSAKLVGVERPAWRVGLNSLGLATLAYLTAAALSGPALACAWAIEALALARIASRSGEPTARHGALSFLGLAGLLVLVAEAPPDALVTGVSDIAAAGSSLGVMAAAMLGIARLQPAGSRLRSWMLTAAAAAGVFLVSVALVSVFQPSAGAASETVLDLGVRQQGQVLLSILWSAIGLTALIVGLKRRQVRLRSAALVWLMVTVTKVFLYDLATLTSLYRVASFVFLGLLLLAGAFAYQRLRPPAVPDMRTVHPSQL